MGSASATILSWITAEVDQALKLVREHIAKFSAAPENVALLKSVPDVRLGARRLVSIDGQPPSIYNLPSGCPFAPRCPAVMPRCSETFPPEVEVAPGHRTSCWKHA